MIHTDGIPTIANAPRCSACAVGDPDGTLHARDIAAGRRVCEAFAAPHPDGGPHQVEATTYGRILHTYAAGLIAGVNDRDASPETRYWAARFLRVVADSGQIAAGVVYPPSDRSRRDLVATLHWYLTRSYGPGPNDSIDAFNAGFALALDVIRNA